MLCNLCFTRSALNDSVLYKDIFYVRIYLINKLLSYNPFYLTSVISLVLCDIIKFSLSVLSYLILMNDYRIRTPMTVSKVYIKTTF